MISACINILFTSTCVLPMASNGVVIAGSEVFLHDSGVNSGNCNVATGNCNINAGNCNINSDDSNVNSGNCNVADGDCNVNSNDCNVNSDDSNVDGGNSNSYFLQRSLFSSIYGTIAYRAGNIAKQTKKVNKKSIEPAIIKHGYLFLNCK